MGVWAGEVLGNEGGEGNEEGRNMSVVVREKGECPRRHLTSFCK